MATCASCNSTILFGGKRNGNYRFCSDKCMQQGILLVVGDEIPQGAVNAYVWRVHQGLCPLCYKNSPVDVHVSYRIYSVILFSSWSSRPVLCCRTCGAKRKIYDAFFSLILGWWGVPWGILITPIQVIRNIFGLFFQPDHRLPSKNLEKILRLDMASRTPQKTPTLKQSLPKGNLWGLSHVFRNWRLYGIVAFFILIWASYMLKYSSTKAVRRNIITSRIAPHE